MQEGLKAYRSTGAELHVPYFLTMLADGHQRLHQLDKGLNVLSEALSRVHQTGECWWEAELHRLEGDYLLQQGVHHATAAEERFRRAIGLAQQRHTKILELRASVSLGRLWQSQGKLRQTRDMIRRLYHGFTEGAETPDLKEAKQLYDACATD
jgi:adenylate cyclase